MKEYIELGTAPIDEDCVQVSSKVDYILEMKDECKRFMKMLEKRFPNMPNGCSFSLKSSPHDFGSYYDVIIKYDDEDEKQSEYAYLVEDRLPKTWDDKEVIFN